jgi:hypothetical protein
VSVSVLRTCFRCKRTVHEIGFRNIFDTVCEWCHLEDKKVRSNGSRRRDRKPTDGGIDLCKQAANENRKYIATQLTPSERMIVRKAADVLGMSQQGFIRQAIKDALAVALEDAQELAIAEMPL